MQSGRYKRRLTKTKKMVHVRLSVGELAIGSIKVDSWNAFFFFFYSFQSMEGSLKFLLK